MIFFILGFVSIFIPILWLIREIKAINFWLYLWQLKEYHIGRIREHFRTTRGKHLFFNRYAVLKLLLLVLWLEFEIESNWHFIQKQPWWPEWESAVALFYAFFVFAVFSVYLFEAAKAISDYAQKKLVAPVLTKKIVILRTFLLVLAIVFLGYPIFALALPFNLPFFIDPLVALVLYDVLTPLIVSGVVLVLQPFTVLWRKKIIAKAKKKREMLADLAVVGITGSYGKTSTKEFLSHILSKKFVVLKTPEHKNSEIGIAHTILHDLTIKHEIFVCEMGAYNRGGIKLLADMAKPTMGIVTGLNEQHLGVFGSAMNLFSAEGGGELIAALPDKGALILNDDSRQLHELGPWLQLWNRNFTNYVWCSAKVQNDVFAKDVVVQKEQVRFTLVLGENEQAQITLPLIGGYNVENVLLAAAAAREFGMSIQEIAEALKDLPVEAGAMILKKGGRNIEILDSSYTSNPTGVVGALEHLKLWKGKKIIVMPSLIELGSASFEVHVTIGRKIGEVCDFAVITTPDEFPALLQGAKEKGMEEKNMVLQESPKKIVEAVFAFLKEGDIVLLEGRMSSKVLLLLQAG
jgi:UDP-N-acetylmuramoyl-tripeptide--D-alanyl-D-alanine ligase